MNNHTASLEITVNVHESVHESMLSQKRVLVEYLKTCNEIRSLLNFHKFLHTIHNYVLNSVVQISMMFAKYFEYYTITLGGGGRFLWTHCS